MAEILQATKTEGGGIGKCKPDITVDLGGRYHSIICIKTLRAQTYLFFQDGKLDKVEQTETITIPK